MNSWTSEQGEARYTKYKILQSGACEAPTFPKPPLGHELRKIRHNLLQKAWIDRSHGTHVTYVTYLLRKIVKPYNDSD